MIKTYDVGSLPFAGDPIKFDRGANTTSMMELLHPTKYSSDKHYFQNAVQKSFKDKIMVGIDVPNYPQFRDMNRMFLSSINGIKKTKEGYVIRKKPNISREKQAIPEILVLKEKSKEISEKTGKTLNIKVCVTGPYTLFSFFPHRSTKLIRSLGVLVSQIVDSNLFKNKFGQTVIFSLDEPVFGLLDDPLLDFGSEGREELLRVWEQIFHKVKSKGVQSCLHLHDTSNELFWQIESLDIVESHVNDPLYDPVRTLELLKKSDKFLKASITITDFDNLIRTHILKSKKMNETTLNLQIANTWTNIVKEKRNPVDFIEEVKTMSARLKKIIKQFGENRIPYAGPECGLQSFPTYSSALECLRRTALAIREISS